MGSVEGFTIVLDKDVPANEIRLTTAAGDEVKITIGKHDKP